MREERSEISLPNGWRSKGLVDLPWRNDGSHVRFLRNAKLQWTMALPYGAYNLAHWNDILVFCQYTEEGKRNIDTLYAQPAGKETTTWKFTLPEDIPDEPFEDFDFRSDRTVRSFSYLVGKEHVFAFGGETLFALDPQTGKLLWRRSVVIDPLKKAKARMRGHVDLIESDRSLLLVSRSDMLRFDLDSKMVAAELRTNLHYPSALTIVACGAVYCFTERK